MRRSPTARCLPTTAPRPAARRATARALAAGVVALAVAGCSDGTGPRVGGGFFRLRTVAGSPLPFAFPPSLGVAGGSIREGQLLLRDDGTFAVGIAAPLGGLLEGSWTRTADGVSLRTPGGGTVAGRWRGDTLALTLAAFGGAVAAPDQGGIDYAFVRADVPTAPVPDGTYALRTVDGRPATADGFVVADVPGPPMRSVQVVRWDTLVVRAPFVTRSEAVTFANGLPLTDPTVLATSSTVGGWGGALEPAGGGRLVIRPFGDRWASGSVADTLVAATDGSSALVRTVARPGIAPRTLRYERVR